MKKCKEGKTQTRVGSRERFNPFLNSLSFLSLNEVEAIFTVTNPLSPARLVSSDVFLHLVIVSTLWLNDGISCKAYLMYHGSIETILLFLFIGILVTTLRFIGKPLIPAE